jgi:hypothetical protein
MLEEAKESHMTSREEIECEKVKTQPHFLRKKESK